MTRETNKDLIHFIEFSRRNFNKKKVKLCRLLRQNMYMFGDFYRLYHQQYPDISTRLVNTIYRNNLDIMFLYIIARTAKIIKDNIGLINIAVLNRSTKVYNINGKSKQGVMHFFYDFEDQDYDIA